MNWGIITSIQGVIVVIIAAIAYHYNNNDIMSIGLFIIGAMFICTGYIIETLNRHLGKK